MGAARIAARASCLLGAGLVAATPVAAIRSATTGDEAISVSTLGDVGSPAHSPPVSFVIALCLGVGPPGGQLREMA